MTSFAVYAADALDAARQLAARTMRRKSALIWFAFLFTGSVWIALRLVELSTTVGLPEGLQVTAGTLLFIAFFGSLAKGAVDAYHRAIRPDALVFVLAQPVPRRAVAVGKFLTVLWFNLAFVAGALALAVVFVAAGMEVPLPWEFGAALILAVVAGLASGVTLAVLGSLSTWPRKAAGLASYAPVVGFQYVALVSANPPLADALLYVLLAAVLSLVGVIASARFLLEAWNNQTAGRRRPGEPRPYLRFRDATLEALVDKELKTMVRKRQVALSLATIGVVGAALLATYATVGPPSELPPAIRLLFYPIVVSTGVYVVASTQLTVWGMAALGKELDALWVLKSAPVSGLDVYRAKAVSVLTLAPPILLAVALPLPIVAGLGTGVTVLLLLTSLAVAFAMAALGLRTGAREPNFDPNTGGLPDSMVLYNIFLVALVLAFAVVAIPAQVFRVDAVLGILAAALTADLAALAIVLATRGAAKRYDDLAA